MNRPLRIGIEVQRIFRRRKHGMEIAALELIREIQKIDRYNEYVLFAKNDDDRECLSELANFKIKPIAGFSYADWEQIQLPKAVNKADLDFLHSTCNTSSLMLRVPLLLTLHDIIYLEKIDFKGTYYQNFGNLYRRFIVPRVAQKSELIITVSNYERNIILEKLKLSKEKVTVVYNAVNAKFNNNYSVKQIVNFRQKHQLPEKFILFLGNTDPKKNTYNVIQAFVEYTLSLNDSIPMVILDYDKIKVRQILVDLGYKHLLSNFIFPGYIPSEDMPLIYNSATIFLYPSLRESFGLPILEAMACGTPVITSNTSSMPEVAGDAALLVNPCMHQQIADCMVKVLTDSMLHGQMSQKGLNRAALFTWESSARTLLSIYSDMSRK